MVGRLHVELVRVAGGVDESMAGGDDSDGSPDGELQERKLVCIKLTCSCSCVGVLVDIEYCICLCYICMCLYKQV